MLNYETGIKTAQNRLSRQREYYRLALKQFRDQPNQDWRDVVSLKYEEYRLQKKKVTALKSLPETARPRELELVVTMLNNIVNTPRSS